jgi:hypothetical protein
VESVHYWQKGDEQGESSPQSFPLLQSYCSYLIFPSEQIPLGYSGWIPYLTNCPYPAYLLTTPVTDSTNSFNSDVCKAYLLFIYKNNEWHIVHNFHSYAMCAKCCNIVIIVELLWTMTIVFCFFHPLTAPLVINYRFNLILRLPS